MSGPIRYTLTGDRAGIELTAPDRLNALSPAAADALLEALAKAEAEARVVVLSAGGGVFCAGADLMSAKGDPRDPEARAAAVADLLTRLNAVCARLMASPIPTVSVVRGAVAGGGIGLALSCDVVLVTPSVQFLPVFAPMLGLAPDMGVAGLLGRSFGRARALSAALLGEAISAEEARGAGLVTECVPDEELNARADALAGQLASGPTKAYAAARALADGAATQDHAAQLAAEFAAQVELARTEDFAEGFAAFTERRAPSFSGA